VCGCAIIRTGQTTCKMQSFTVQETSWTAVQPLLMATITTLVSVEPKQDTQVGGMISSASSVDCVDVRGSNIL